MRGVMLRSLGLWIALGVGLVFHSGARRTASRSRARTCPSRSRPGWTGCCAAPRTGLRARARPARHAIVFLPRARRARLRRERGPLPRRAAPRAPGLGPAPRRRGAVAAGRARSTASPPSSSRATARPRSGSRPGSTSRPADSASRCCPRASSCRRRPRCSPCAWAVRRSRARARRSGRARLAAHAIRGGHGREPARRGGEPARLRSHPARARDAHRAARVGNRARGHARSGAARRARAGVDRERVARAPRATTAGCACR